MKHILYPLLLITGSLLACLWYCAALIDWIQEYSSGYYAYHRIEQVLETAGILLYTYLGVRFLRKNVDFFP